MESQNTSDEKIKHVFLLMLENRSFDQVLGCYPGVEGLPKEGEPARFNEDSQGTRYYQRAFARDTVPFDPDHEHIGILEQLENDCGGFVENFEKTHNTRDKDALQSVMDYYPAGSLPAIDFLARNFTICDRWFASVPGPTWANRLFLLTGTSAGRVLMGSKDYPQGFVPYVQDSIFDRLHDARISWRVYRHGLPNSWLLIKQVFAEGRIDCYKEIGRPGIAGSFEDHLRREGSSFPQFCFIEPEYFGVEQNDDHPTSSALEAQRLIARVYNAIRSVKEVWESSLLILLYDEHGGFYDHVMPPEAVAPSLPAGYGNFDPVKCPFNRLGVRVPALLVSPWVHQGVYSATMDHTSVLRYLCQKWELEPLSERDAQAHDFSEAFLPKRRDVPNDRIAVDEPRSFCGTPGLQQAESGHQQALREMCARLEVETGVPQAATTMALADEDAGEEMRRRANAIQWRAEQRAGGL